jgi:hypothetical protein
MTRVVIFHSEPQYLEQAITVVACANLLTSAGCRESVWGSRTRTWCLTSDSGCRLVLVEEPAEDRSTPNPTMNWLGNRDVGRGGRSRSARCGRRAL